MLKRTLSAAGLVTTLALLGAACTPTTTVPSATQDTNTAAVVPTTVPLNATVIAMTDDAFTPSEVSIKQGDTVTFVNRGTQPIWPASAPHPSHTNYPEFDPKMGIAPGSSWSFTFTKVGGWFYHDHLNSKHFGKVTVTQ